MSVSLLAVATALPEHCLCQASIAEKMCAMYGLDVAEGRSLRELYANTAIKKRYTVVPDFLYPRQEWHFFGADYPKTFPGMSQRNTAYKQYALPLALKAAQSAIARWQGCPQEITHIISVSCTGIVAPGLEFDLMQALNLSPWTFRLGINFMGCFGAFKGLSIAKALANENPKNRVLVVCTELCSLHMQKANDSEALTANAIFADGAAAAIVGATPKSHESPLWTMVSERSYGLSGSKEKMSWEASSEGFLMKLSYKVPVLISKHIKPFVDGLLEKNADIATCRWAIHPGGKSILQAIERALKLIPVQTAASWEVLANCGNMSSATFLFVLEQLAAQECQRKWIAGLGFGPGLSMEGILLKAPLES